MPCIKVSEYTTGTIRGTYETLEACQDNCNCSIFPACQPNDGTYAPFCPEGCTLDEPGDAPPACVCCNGTTGCPVCGSPCPQGFVGSGPLDPQDFSQGLVCCPESHPYHQGGAMCTVDSNNIDPVSGTIIDVGCYQ